MAEVQNCTVDGAMVVAASREGYVPLTADAVHAGNQSSRGVTVVSNANWLAYQLLREAFPPELTPLTPALAAHDIKFPFFHAHYNGPGTCRPLNASAVEKLSGLAADDGSLRAELAEQLAAVPPISAVAFQKKYLQGPPKPLAEAVAAQRTATPSKASR